MKAIRKKIQELSEERKYEIIEFWVSRNDCPFGVIDESRFLCDRCITPPRQLCTDCWNQEVDDESN